MSRKTMMRILGWVETAAEVFVSFLGLIMALYLTIHGEYGIVASVWLCMPFTCVGITAVLGWELLKQRIKDRMSKEDE